jgi:hypothetical protein
MDLDAVVVEMSTGTVHVLLEDGWFITIPTGRRPQPLSA